MHLCDTNLPLKSNNFVSEEPRQNKGLGLVNRKLTEAPSNFIAGRSKAVLLLRILDDFRCGVLLLIVILVLYINIENGKNTHWDFNKFAVDQPSLYLPAWFLRHLVVRFA